MIRSLIRVVGALLLGPAAISGSLAATVFASGTVSFLDSNDQRVSNPCFTTSTVSGTTVGCSGSTSVPGTSATLNYLTSATADYGVLKVSGRSSITNPSPSGAATVEYSSSKGDANFRDQWTISGATIGSPGTLQLQFALTGAFDLPIGTGVSTGFSLFNRTENTFSVGTPSLPGNGLLDTIVTFNTAFDFGSELDFQVFLSAGSLIYNLTQSGLASYMDLSNTAVMTAIIVRDSTGAVVPFNLLTASGASLFRELAPGIPNGTVPEPSTVALSAAALALLAMARRRRAFAVRPSLT